MQTRGSVNFNFAGGNDIKKPCPFRDRVFPVTIIDSFENVVNFCKPFGGIFFNHRIGYIFFKN